MFCVSILRRRWKLGAPKNTSWEQFNVLRRLFYFEAKNLAKKQQYQGSSITLALFSSKLNDVVIKAVQTRRLLLVLVN
jgi:hypothetical protein